MLAEDEQENLEEIEALLYAQVYHESAAENELEESKDPVTISTVNIENGSGPVTVQKQSFRYFDECNKLIFYEDRNASLDNTELNTATNTPNIIPNNTEIDSNITQTIQSTHTTESTSSAPPVLNYLSLDSGNPNSWLGELPDFVLGIIKKFGGITPNIVSHLCDINNWPNSLKQDLSLFLHKPKHKRILIKNLRYEIRQHIRERNKVISLQKRQVKREIRIFKATQERVNQQVIFLSSDSENETANDNLERGVTQKRRGTGRMPRNSGRDQTPKSAKHSKQKETLPCNNNNVVNESDDDEIIYIAPPPVAVVTVDTDSESDEIHEAANIVKDGGNIVGSTEDSVEKSGLEKQPPAESTEENASGKKKKNKSVDPEPTERPLQDVPSTSLYVEEETSNDFLSNEPSQSQTDNFNFALHGSDFNNADFVRPANPAECYETESSTSTSDFNRDSSRNYSNSVKTIVFNEVEFPKEDIFTNNLEGFEELITTKETPAKKKKSVKDKRKETPKSSKTVVSQKEACGSDSSSESDYEQTFDNLPSLSPMFRTNSPKKGQKTTPKTSKKRNKRLSEEPIESLEEKSARKKKKSKSLDFENPVNQPSETLMSVEEQTNANKKKKNKTVVPEVVDKQVEDDSMIGLSIVDEAQATPNKKANKKKKKKSGSKSNEENEEQVDAGVEGGLDVEIEKFYTEIDHQVEAIKLFLEEETPQSKKKKKNNKKKKKQNTSQETEIETSSNIVPVETSKTDDKNDDVTETNDDNDDDEVILIDNTPAPIEIQDSDDNSDNDEGGPNVDTPDLQLANTVAPTKEVEEPVKISGLDRDFSEFDVHNLQAKMSDDPGLWRISVHDRVVDRYKKRGPRCTRCKQFGHFAVRCPNKPSQPSCQLCGEVGHEEPRCPNKVCFSCGNKGNFSTVYCWRCVKNRNHECTVCKCVGHISENCPDLWRRYHLTTTPGPLVTPKTGPQLRPKKERWCSGCASQGHFDYECNSYKYIREYPAAVPSIKEYSCVYDEDKVPQQPPDQSVIPEINPVENIDNASQNIHAIASNPQSSENQNPTNDVAKQNFEKAFFESLQKNLPKINVEDRLALMSKPSFGERLIFSPPENRFQPNPSSETQTQPNQNFTYDVNQSQNFMQSNQSIFNVNNDFLNQMVGYNTQPVLNVFAPLANNIVANQINNLLNNVNNANNLHPPLMSNQMDYIQNEPGLMPDGQNIYNMPSSSVYNIPEGTDDYPRQNYANDPAFVYQQFKQNIPNFNENDTRMQRKQRTTALAAPQNIINFNQNFEHSAGADFNRNNTKRRQKHTVTNRDRIYEQFKQTLREDPKAPAPPQNIINFNQNFDQPTQNSATSNQKNAEMQKNTASFQRSQSEKSLRIFRDSQVKDLHEFVQEELGKLRNMEGSANSYRKKLHVIDGLNKKTQQKGVAKQQQHLYKNINMYLFGMRKLKDGKRHFDFLQNFVYQPGICLKPGKRKQLHEAYDYIFGGRHHGINYKTLVNNLVVGNRSGCKFE